MKEINGAIYELRERTDICETSIKLFQLSGESKVYVDGSKATLSSYFYVGNYSHRFKRFIKIKVMNLTEFYSEWLKDIERALREEDTVYYDLIQVAKDIITLCLNSDLDIEIPEMLSEI